MTGRTKGLIAMPRLAVFIAAIASAIALLTAQTPQESQPAPTFRAGVDVVQFDVSVLDKNRQPVKGLTSADFTVLDHGKPVPIVGFAPVDVPDASDTPARWMHDVASDVVSNDINIRRVVIIVLDDAYMPFDPGVSKTAKQIAHEVVDRLGPNDLAAVTFTMYGRKQDITTDRAKLNKAIDTLVPHPGDAPAPPQFSAAKNPSIGPQVGPPPCRNKGLKGCVLDTLIHVADALLGGPAGRKTLVYISSGVPYSFTLDNLEAGDQMDDLGEMFAKLQEANVNVYSFDPQGLTTDGILTPGMDALRMFSDETGGRAVVGRNYPWEEVPQVFRENSSYYLLGIRRSSVADGTFHHLEVRVNRPDIDVRSRSGYYAPDAPNRKRKPVPAVTPMDKALGSGLPTGDVGLQVHVAPFALVPQRDATLAITIGFPPRSIPPQPQPVKLVATVFDQEWKQRAINMLTVQLGPSAPPVPVDEFFIRLRLPKGRYQIRVGADEEGQTGSVFTDVDIADFTHDALSASGLVLSTNHRVARAGEAVLADILPVIPTTMREFTATDQVTAFLRVYQKGSATPTAVHMKATILGDADRMEVEESSVLEGPAFAGGSGADYRFNLPISKLDSGAHLLRIDATAGRTTIQQLARFSVR